MHCQNKTSGKWISFPTHIKSKLPSFVTKTRNSTYCQRTALSSRYSSGTGTRHDTGIGVRSLIVRDALLQIFKVRTPRFVDTVGVGHPSIVHLFGVERAGAVEEGFIGMEGGVVGVGVGWCVVLNGGGCGRFEAGGC